ncbi:MAG: hypothetical protein HYT12_00410 [Candidatus Liptonbacteria bacterium]|nr:hypothetical protein [Candidatus Liptonbacteria bacterium]
MMFVNKFYLKLKNYSFKGEGGQLLIEAMVAISIIVVGLFGILELLSSSLGLNKVIAGQYKAAYLASEGVEVVKNIVDENMAAGRPWNETVWDVCMSESGGDGCVVEYNTDAGGLGSISLQGFLGFPLRFRDGIYSYDLSGAITPFTRIVTVDMVSDGTAPQGCQIKVTSRVDWRTRGGGEFKIQIEDRFYNWRGSAC